MYFVETTKIGANEYKYFDGIRNYKWPNLLHQYI
jgi:hypothetical protein